jgi:hypothetical protein
VRTVGIEVVDERIIADFLHQQTINATARQAVL